MPYVSYSDGDSSPDLTAPPVRPTTIESGKFNYDGQSKQLSYGRIQRVGIGSLKRLRTKANKDWVIAQLALYGIPFKKSDSAVNLKELLGKAVLRKKSLDPTPEFQAFEASLVERYNQQLEEHEQALKTWKVGMFLAMSSPTQEARHEINMFLAKYFLTDGKPDKTKQKEALILHGLLAHEAKELKQATEAIPDLTIHITRYISIIGWEGTLQKAMPAAFAKISSARDDWVFDIPTEEAEFSVDLFLEKYFLHHGSRDNSDRKKTTETLQLTCLSSEKVTQLEEAIKAVPGLHTECIWPYQSFKDIIIGWDLEKINSQIQAIHDEHAAEKAREEAEEQAREEQERAAYMKPHTDFMKTHTPSQGPLTLNDLAGSYLATSDFIQAYTGGNWDETELSIDILPPTNPQALGVIASFSLGCNRGTMLLSLSEDSLHSFAEEQALIDPESYSDSDSDQDSDHDSEGNEWDGIRGLGDIAGTGDSSRKRKRKDQATPNANRTIRRRLGETQTTATRPNRVYFRWAGATMHTNDLDGTTDEIENAGYIDFEPSKAVAKGEFVMCGSFGTKKLDLAVHKAGATPVVKDVCGYDRHVVPWSHWREDKFYKYNKKWSNQW